MAARAADITDYAVKKLDAPPLLRIKATAVAAAPEFALLSDTLTNANAALVGITNPTMRVAAAKTLLDMVIKEAERVRIELESATT